MCKCTPRTRSAPPARAAGLDLEVYLDRLLRATTKKGRQIFDEKVHRRQNPGYAYELCVSACCVLAFVVAEMWCEGACCSSVYT